MYSASDVAIVRLMTGDFVQANVNDELTPLPDGVNTIFRLSNYPIGASLPTLYEVVAETATSQPIPSASWTIIDSENGVIRMSYSPAASTSYLSADYYTWSFLSDATVLSALTNRSGNWRRAAIDLIMYILSDPQGTFFQVFQSGDDSFNAGLNIPRLQSVVAELWRQESLPEFAGSANIPTSISSIYGLSPSDDYLAALIHSTGQWGLDLGR